MKIKKEIIKFILSEQEKVKEYSDVYATHIPAKGRVIARLLYYQPSIWEADNIIPSEDKPKNKKKSSLIIGADLNSLLDSSKDVTVDKSKDGVIPFVLILNGGNTGGENDAKVETGEVWQVSRERVTGEVFNQEYLAMADLIKKDVNSAKSGKTMLSAVNTPAQKLDALLVNWGRYSIETPWIVADDMEGFQDTFTYELATPELRGKIDLEKLKELIEYVD